MNYSWLPDYLLSILRRPRQVSGTKHLIFCVADHFEPFGWKQARAKNLARVDEWAAAYPTAFAAFRDADGFTPRHTFFCSAEDYAPDYIAKVQALVAGGHGEVELHLHHRNDTPEGFREKLVRFRDVLHGEHGLLGTWRGDVIRYSLPVIGGKGRGEGGRGTSVPLVASGDASGTLAPRSAVSPPAYAFVHGNWALCNARPDGDWCGVNEELAILAETGCYADFTFPSAPDPTQPRIVNRIYRAVDRPGGRGQESGVRSQGAGGRSQGSGVRGQGAGGRGQGGETGSSELGTRSGECEHRTSNVEHRTSSEGEDPQYSNTPLLHYSLSPSAPTPPHTPTPLLLIQGPLGLDWRNRKRGILPRLENADLSRARPPTPRRADLWVRQHIHVQGRPEWVFVKVHTHGIVPYNTHFVLGEPMQRLHAHLGSRYNDGRQWMLHYVTAREMYNLVRAAEDGMTGAPGAYRDYEIAPPACVGKT